MRVWRKFLWPFCPYRKAANFCHPDKSKKNMTENLRIWGSDWQSCQFSYFHKIVRYSLQCSWTQMCKKMTHELWLTSVPIGSHDHFDKVWAKGKSLKKNGSIVTKRQQLTSSYLYFYLQTVPSSQTVMRMLPSRLRLVWRIAVVHWNFDKSILLIRIP